MSLKQQYIERNIGNTKIDKKWDDVGTGEFSLSFGSSDVDWTLII
jgi:hypothetical protein